MLFKPKRWTEHHNLRLFHASMLAAFLMICAVVISGMFFILANSFASAESKQTDVTASATVPEFSSGTTTPVISGGGGGSYFLPNSTSTGPSLAYQFPQASITLQADPGISEAQNVTEAGGLSQRTIYVFKNDRPRFLGSTNVDNGFVFIDISGPISFGSSAEVDGNNAFQWQSPEALPAGVYTVTAMVQDPWHSERTAAAALQFAVGKPGTVLPPAAPLEVVPPRYFLLVKIPGALKIVRPGQEAGVAVKIITQSKTPKNIILEYTISNSQGTVGTYQDAVNVNAGGAEFLKTFYTNPLAQAGDYTITVRAHEGKQLLSAADTFTVQGRGIIPVSGTMFVDFTVIFQILLVLFLLFGLIAYFEYNKVAVMSRIIRQVTEDDLKAEADKNKINDKTDKA